MLDKFLFVGFPYIAFSLALVVGILRFIWRPFSYSSLSSQFLENKQLFWGSGLWHWGILWVLLGHLGAFLMPRQILAWNAQPLRLYLLEASGLIMALLALVGVIALMVRRSSTPKIKVVTTAMIPTALPPRPNRQPRMAPQVIGSPFSRRREIS